MRSYEVNAVGVTLGEPSPMQRTYIIAGVERGGTTPVAGAARALGLYLGEGLQRNNEDPRFVHRGPREVIQAIHERDAEHSVWGWKFPKAFLDLPLYLEHLRNPHLILVFRDPIAAAMGHHRWSGEGMRKAVNFHIGEAQAFNSLNAMHAMTAGLPTLLISHEKWLFHTAQGIDALAGFLLVEPPCASLRRRILRYLRSKEYKDYAEFFKD